jgi:membrane-bound serine protease (ClpP class)
LFHLQIDWWVIVIVAVFFAALFLFAVGAVIRAHRRRPATGKEGLPGKIARARTVLDPEGMVFVEGELWTATSDGDRIEPGEEVVVTKVEGLKLRVVKKDLGG